MSNVYYQLYLRQVFDLTRTMVVKSSKVAELINREVRYITGAVNTDPATWRYYMHLAGEYHPTDTMMTVTSMDTLETIEFTKENLQLYRATAEAYEYGSRYYRDLVNAYPGQESLILGILNPINKQKAIDAHDGEILYYDAALVEPQEVSLIPRLQRFIDAYFSRWSNAMYAEVDEYFIPAQVGVLFSQIPHEILNARLEACLTNETHSFHIREYLASHSEMDRFLGQMTLKQTLFIYRNIRYLQRNAGTRQNFKLLLNRIMSERNLPLAEYRMVHRTLDLVENFVPEIEMMRLPLNDHPGDGSSDRRSVNDLLTKQFIVAKGNEREFDDAVITTTGKMQYSPSSMLQSKTLESALLDTTDSVPFTKEEVVLNNWLYLSTTERFNAIVNVNDPVTGVSVPLSAKDAFLVFLYAFNKEMGVTLTDIPTLWARYVQRPVQPTLNELLSRVDTSIVYPGWVSEIKNRQPAMGVYISLGAFQDFCQAQFIQKNRQRNIYAQLEDPNAKAQLESATMYLYQDVKCEMYSGESYEQWMVDRGLNWFNLDTDDLGILASTILESVAGEVFGVAGSSLGLLQKTMLGIMESLSSYSVQYLQSINTTAYRVIDTAYPRVHNLDSHYKSQRYIELGDVDLHNPSFKSGHTIGATRQQPTIRRIVMDAVNTDIIIRTNHRMTLSDHVHFSQSIPQRTPHPITGSVHGDYSYLNDVLITQDGDVLLNMENNPIYLAFDDENQT